jgi:hypothetical protein
MTSLFYKFTSMTKSETLFLNKEQICSICQIGIGEGTQIKLTNGSIFMVEQTAEQILLILSGELK